MLRNLRKPAVRRKRCGLLSSGMCLQHDNARLSTARHTVKQIQDCKTGGVTTSAIFTRFGIRRFSLLLLPTRRSTWTPFQIG
ncbi:hypothetical protein Cfor_09401 [Coptotermes formosanus]|uniref:Uncharacterized protein n=1 Tax=Coptotermes formosanus TaxID=36987 RepID=A0A6L2PVM6_COPFO|nr:hypothetical protein Cfor_09401 [Coptotermes formosanus]